MEKIQYAGSNWFIKKETSKNLMLTKKIKGFNTDIVITTSVDDPLLNIPIEEVKQKNKLTRTIIGDPIFIPFDISIIEELSKGKSSSNKRKVIYN